MIRIGIAGLEGASIDLLDQPSTGAYEMAAVWDRSAPRARSAAQRIGAQAVKSLASMLDLDLDAVVVSGRRFLENDVLACAEAGTAVLTWLDADGPTVDACETACRDNETVYMVGTPWRYRTAVLRARKILNDNLLGDVIAIRAVTHRPAEATLRGVMAESALHAVDLIRWLALSEVTQVYADTASTGKRGKKSSDGENLVVLHLELEGDRFAGVTAAALLPKHHPARDDLEIEIVAERGTMRLRPGNQHVEWVGSEKPTCEHLPWGDAPAARCVAAFAQAVEEERPMPVPVASARQSVRVIEAARLSAQTGKPMAVAGRSVPS